MNWLTEKFLVVFDVYIDVQRRAIFSLLRDKMDNKTDLREN
jgi:hypothetical protein